MSTHLVLEYSPYDFPGSTEPISYELGISRTLALYRKQLGLTMGSNWDRNGLFSVFRRRDFVSIRCVLVSGRTRILDIWRSKSFLIVRFLRIPMWN